MKPKRPRDTNQLAKMIVDLTTRTATEPEPDAGKDRAAVERGRRGGLSGGKARADALSARKRKQIAKKALSMCFDPPLDRGITQAVHALTIAGVETFESCEGGSGHAYPEPTVRFHGDHAEGLRALAVALSARLPVRELRRVWPVLDDEPTGPWWELTFNPATTQQAVLDYD